MAFLIDSDVLIDVSRGNSGAISYLDGLTESWVLSQVTALELIVGARDKREVSIIDEFFSNHGVIPLTENVGIIAYRLLKTYAKSHGLRVFDSLIAATANDNGLVLVSRNQRHYRMIEELHVAVPGY